MNITVKFSVSVVFFVCLMGLAIASAYGQQKQIPEVLEPWKDWVLWGEQHPDCPTPYNVSAEHICFWPSRLSLTAKPEMGSWNLGVKVFEPTWVPLPGSSEMWPLNVSDNGQPVTVLPRNGRPSVWLSADVHQLAGEFLWDEMPQKISVPQEVGILSLVVADKAVPIPNWDTGGDVWLKRVRAEPADEDFLAAKVYRVIEDGIPIWLHTEIELSVAGKSREEQLGWTLPEGWQLSRVESPIPVAVDDQGRMKAQVRAGKWTIALHAFRTTDVTEFQFAADAQPVASSELIGLQANSDFRISEIEGIPAVDVTQTMFPDKWRELPVYRWETNKPFRLVEKMRGMGMQRPAGLAIDRQFWMDEDGRGIIYRDRLRGQMQQIWRLDAAEGQQLGAVRIDGEGQLITANPKTGAHGVEIRKRNLNLNAIGSMDRTSQLSAIGWQTDAESLSITLYLPPGWRVLALFGADRVEGDWLTAWSLLDLFLLLIFSLAVGRMWGVTAGIVALLAFGLAYHEPGAPRLTWLFLLMPLALLRVVPPEGAGYRWINRWKYLAIALLVINLVPFVASQIQSTIYPQLEAHGRPYGARDMFWRLAPLYQRSVDVAEMVTEDSVVDPSVARGKVFEEGEKKQANLMFDPNAKIQTGPAEPEWRWNQINCRWNSPVTSEQRITPILISLPVHRLLTVVRLIFLMILAVILLRARRFWNPFSRRQAAVVAAICTFLLSDHLLAQIPDKEMLSTLRQRLLEPSEAFPQAGEIPVVQLKLGDGRMVMETEIHAAREIAVPLPGRFPSWSPLTVGLNGAPDAVVCRHDGFLWVTVPKGVHHVTVEGLLPDVTEWEWTFLLKPRHVTIDAPDWNVTGLLPNSVPEQQVFFLRKEKAAESEVSYDQKNFNAIVAVERQLEIGLGWKISNSVTRLSAPGKAISLKIPLLVGESVLTSNMVVQDGQLEVRLGATQDRFTWDSELPISNEIRLQAGATDQWVERWQMVTSSVWNVSLAGLAPVFESSQGDLVPVWHPWPGESVVLSFSRPRAVSGEVVTVQRVNHKTSLGVRQRTTQLKLDLQCSLGGEFAIEFDRDAEITSLDLDGRRIPAQRDGAKLIVPVRPGRQSIEVGWKNSQPLQPVVRIGQVTLPVEAANVTTVLRVPENRWVLWADGPLRGPAVRFWTILVFAVLAAFVLASLSRSPLGRLQWMLLALGLTQIHVGPAMLVVAWLFLLAWRGRQQPDQMRRWPFNLLQLALVLITMAALGVLIVVVGQGLLGNPEMFIIGNNSSRTYLQWFQGRVGGELPVPRMVSISVWFYRGLMLCWALWLATALLGWLKWGWQQYSNGGCWRRRERIVTPVEVVPDSNST